MKKFTLFLLALLFAFLGKTNATILVVDNNPANPSNPGTNYYTTVQSAISAAVNGDTVYVIGSLTEYTGSIDVDKELKIFGPGYFLNENPQTQAYQKSAIFSDGVNFKAASSGSVISGIYFKRIVRVQTSNITIQRCRFEGNYYNDGQFLFIEANHSNITIRQNYFRFYRTGNSQTLRVENGCANILIANNFIENSYVQSGNSNYSVLAYSPVLVTNNVLYNLVYAPNSILENNILRYGTFSGSNSTFQNNIADTTQFGNLNGNLENIDMNLVFEGAGSTDGKWQLATGSVAIGAGTNGTDCGIFGGTNPYVLSGIPPIPTIYDYLGSATATSANGLSVTVQVKSNN